MLSTIVYPSGTRTRGETDGGASSLHPASTPGIDDGTQHPRRRYRDSSSTSTIVLPSIKAAPCDKKLDAFLQVARATRYKSPRQSYLVKVGHDETAASYSVTGGIILPDLHTIALSKHHLSPGPWRGSQWRQSHRYLSCYDTLVAPSAGAYCLAWVVREYTWRKSRFPRPERFASYLPVPGTTFNSIVLELLSPNVANQPPSTIGC